MNNAERWARGEARSRLRMNRKLNDAEFAYSPKHYTVGMRWCAEQSFRVFNIRYAAMCHEFACKTTDEYMTIHWQFEQQTWARWALDDLLQLLRVNNER